jgi:hypothetical protein
LAQMYSALSDLSKSAWSSTIDIWIASIYLEQLIMTYTNCRIMAAGRLYSRREDIFS